MPDIIFNGPVGRIEGRYQPGKSPTAPLALILHSSPNDGGTMNDKVCYTLYKAFIGLGCTALRFNFRGVGRSQGNFDNGIGELTDAAAVLDWVQQFHREAQTCWIAGFSFGAWIGMQLMMRRPEITDFISVAPPANLYDFSFLTPCPANGLIVHGSADEIVPVASVESLVGKLKAQRQLKASLQIIDRANHSFEGELPELAKVCSSFITSRTAA